MSKRMLVLELDCPHCRAKLTEKSEVRLDGHVRATDQDGEIILSAVLGDYTLKTDLDVPEGGIIDYRCPRCDASIMLPVACRKCAAPMASLDHAAGGYIEFCSRRGCKGHAFGGEGDPDQMMELMNRMFGTPYD
jgi:hypothetical protein